MHLYPFKVPRIARALLGGIAWQMDPGLRRIYLTFDDGPVPEATPWVLRRLEEFDAKATFFCVGHNIDKHPRIFDRLVRAGHTPANHTYNHLNGFAQTGEAYLENIRKTERLTGTRLFRPPYGRLTPEQYTALHREGYRIVLCDVISGDFDSSQPVDRLQRNLLANTQDGSIVLFHDSIKAIPRTGELLPAFLRHFSLLGYNFCALPPAPALSPIPNPQAAGTTLAGATTL